MKGSPIFATIPDAEFFGRTRLLRHITGSAAETGAPAAGLVVAGRRWTGKTEVLRRVHRELFWKQARYVPVYFQFKAGTIEGFSEDFLRELARQYLAFTERDVDAARRELSLENMERLVQDKGMTALSGLLSGYMGAVRSGDVSAALRGAVSSPRLLEEAGLPVFLVLDDLDRALEIRFRGMSLADCLFEELERSPHQFLASATSTESLPDFATVLRLDGLDEEEGVGMMAELSRRSGVGFDTEILAASARRLGGNPLYMKSLVLGARGKRKNLASLKDLAAVYADEVTSGSISGALRRALRLGGDDLRVLHAVLKRGAAREEDFSCAERLERGHVARILDRLSSTGLVLREPGLARWAGDSVEGDFINYMYEVAVSGRTPEEARCRLSASVLKECFDSRGEKLRGRFKEEVASLLRSFDGQKVPKALLNYRAFSPEPGAEDKTEGMPVPYFTGSFEAARLEKNERPPVILIAQGFQRGRFEPGSEVVWIVGVKDSLTPVNIGDAENFIRRAALLKAGFRKMMFARWLIGREGFTRDAVERLEQEGVYSTDAKGLMTLNELVSGPGGMKTPSIPGKEFELTLPMSKNAELVAAKAGDEISSGMGFGQEARDQIKAALVEACINAFEHGGAVSGRTHLRFVLSPDRLTVYVSNTGARFDSASLKTPAPRGLPQRRGWGIELMKGLMDEVRFEEVDGGTRVVLVKYLAPTGEANVHGPRKP